MQNKIKTSNNTFIIDTTSNIILTQEEYNYIKEELIEIFNLTGRHHLGKIALDRIHEIIKPLLEEYFK